ncbi:MAG: iron ABC transporter permease [Planctomycetota bacterium]|nr:iron ABC transporter permease [Planctomycetota bacterium]
MTLSNRRSMLGLIAVVIGLVLFRLVLGRTSDGTLSLDLPSGIALQLRSGAVFSGALAGACLGLAGLLLQILLRNPLAAPSVLGVTSGAALGVSAATVLSVNAGSIAGSSFAALLAQLGGIELIGAMVGSLCSLFLLGWMARRRGGIDPISLVLAGVVLGAVFGAIAMALQWMLPPHSRADVSLWMMGRVPEWPNVGVAIVGAAVFSLVLLSALRQSTALDIASASEDEARSLGVRIGKLRNTLFVGAGLLTGSAVALCGPIAFVGFVAPHLARIVVGVRSRSLIFAAPLCGIIVLVGADVARLLIPTSHGRLPVGILTALLGGIWFLRFIGRGREAWS